MRRKFEANSYLPYRAHAAPLPCCTVALRSYFQNGMVGARHGCGMGMTWHVWIKNGQIVYRRRINSEQPTRCVYLCPSV